MRRFIGQSNYNHELSPQVQNMPDNCTIRTNTYHRYKLAYDTRFTMRITVYALKLNPSKYASMPTRGANFNLMHCKSEIMRSDRSTALHNWSMI